LCPKNPHEEQNIVSKTPMPKSDILNFIIDCKNTGMLFMPMLIFVD